jgi:hypothetical protein
VRRWWHCRSRRWWTGGEWGQRGWSRQGKTRGRRRPSGGGAHDEEEVRSYDEEEEDRRAELMRRTKRGVV